VATPLPLVDVSVSVAAYPLVPPISTIGMQALLIGNDPAETPAETDETYDEDLSVDLLLAVQPFSLNLPELEVL